MCVPAVRGEQECGRFGSSRLALRRRPPAGRRNAETRCTRLRSGSNSTLREFGGVFGVAVLAAVFARSGVYTSPQTFIDGFSAALWVGTVLSVIGMVAAVLSPGRHRPGEVEAVARPTVALGGEPAEPVDQDDNGGRACHRRNRT
jgi:hypothetical protein